MRHGHYNQDARVRKEVLSLIDAGYEVDVICLRLPKEKTLEVIGNLRIFRLPFSHQRNSILSYIFLYILSFLMMTFLVSILFLKRRYALIQVSTMPDFLVFATIIPKLLGAGILLDLLEPTPELWLSIYEDKDITLLIKFFIRIEQLAIAYSDKVITVNDTIRQLFIERGASSDDIFVVRNVPTDTFTVNDTPGLPQDAFNLITHGSIEKRYGHEVILRAMPKLRQNIRNPHLYIIGDGEYEAHLQDLVHQLGIDDVVTFTGRVPFSDVPGIIKSADVGIVSLLPTPFGKLCQPNKLFEYVEMIKPVIAPRLEAIEEIFNDECVFFFDPGDENDLADRIIELHEYSELGKIRAENAWQVYQTMKWSKTKEYYLELIRDTIKGPVPAMPRRDLEPVFNGAEQSNNSMFVEEFKEHRNA